MITVTSGNISHINQGWQFPCGAQYYAIALIQVFCTFHSRVAKKKTESDCRLMQKNTGEQKGEYCYNRPCNFVFGNDTHCFDAQNAFMLVIRPRRAGINILVSLRFVTCEWP